MKSHSDREQRPRNQAKAGLLESDFFECIITINETGLGVLMVEQNARMAPEIAHCGYVLATARTCSTETGADLPANREVAQLLVGG